MAPTATMDGPAEWERRREPRPEREYYPREGYQRERAMEGDWRPRAERPPDRPAEREREYYLRGDAYPRDREYYYRERDAAAPEREGREREREPRYRQERGNTPGRDVSVPRDPTTRDPSGDRGVSWEYEAPLAREAYPAWEGHRDQNREPRETHTPVERVEQQPPQREGREYTRYAYLNGEGSHRDHRDEEEPVRRTSDRSASPSSRKPRHAPAQPCAKKGHEQYLRDIYCNVENTLCCLLCLRRDEAHRHHKCVAIQPASTNMRASVVDWMSNAQKQKSDLSSVQQRLDHAIDKLTKSAESEIGKLEETVEELKRKLEANKKQLVEHARLETQAEVQRLQEVRADVSQYAAKIDETMGEVQKLNASSSVAELIHLKKFITLTAFQKDKQSLPVSKIGFKAHSAVHVDKLFDIGHHNEEIALPACYNPSNAVIEREVVPTSVDFSVYNSLQ